MAGRGTETAAIATHPPTMKEMAGFVCEHCGLVIEGGLFAEAQFRIHVQAHLQRAATLVTLKPFEITADDKTFLKVQRIKWE